MSDNLPRSTLVLRQAPSYEHDSEEEEEDDDGDGGVDDMEVDDPPPRDHASLMETDPDFMAPEVSPTSLKLDYTGQVLYTISGSAGIHSSLAAPFKTRAFPRAESNSSLSYLHVPVGTSGIYLAAASAFPVFKCSGRYNLPPVPCCIYVENVHHLIGLSPYLFAIQGPGALRSASISGSSSLQPMCTVVVAGSPVTLGVRNETRLDSFLLDSQLDAFSDGPIPNPYVRSDWRILDTFVEEWSEKAKTVLYDSIEGRAYYLCHHYNGLDRQDLRPLGDCVLNYDQAKRVLYLVGRFLYFFYNGDHDEKTHSRITRAHRVPAAAPPLYTFPGLNHDRAKVPTAMAETVLEKMTSAERDELATLRTRHEILFNLAVDIMVGKSKRKVDAYHKTSHSTMCAVAKMVWKEMIEPVPLTTPLPVAAIATTLLEKFSIMRGDEMGIFQARHIYSSVPEIGEKHAWPFPLQYCQSRMSLEAVLMIVSSAPRWLPLLSRVLFSNRALAMQCNANMPAFVDSIKTHDKVCPDLICDILTYVILAPWYMQAPVAVEEFATATCESIEPGDDTRRHKDWAERQSFLLSPVLAKCKKLIVDKQKVAGGVTISLVKDMEPNYIAIDQLNSCLKRISPVGDLTDAYWASVVSARYVAPEYTVASLHASVTHYKTRARESSDIMEYAPAKKYNNNNNNNSSACTYADTIEMSVAVDHGHLIPLQTPGRCYLVTSKILESERSGKFVCSGPASDTIFGQNIRTKDLHSDSVYMPRIGTAFRDISSLHVTVHNRDMLFAWTDVMNFFISRGKSIGAWTDLLRLQTAVDQSIAMAYMCEFALGEHARLNGAFLYMPLSITHQLSIYMNSDTDTESKMQKAWFSLTSHGFALVTEQSPDSYWKVAAGAETLPAICVAHAEAMTLVDWRCLRDRIAILTLKYDAYETTPVFIIGSPVLGGFNHKPWSCDANSVELLLHLFKMAPQVDVSFVDILAKAKLTVLADRASVAHLHRDDMDDDADDDANFTEAGTIRSMLAYSIGSQSGDATLTALLDLCEVLLAQGMTGVGRSETATIADEASLRLLGFTQDRDHSIDVNKYTAFLGAFTVPITFCPMTTDAILTSPCCGRQTKTLCCHRYDVDVLYHIAHNNIPLYRCLERKLIRPPSVAHRYRITCSLLKFSPLRLANLLLRFPPKTFLLDAWPSVWKAYRIHWSDQVRNRIAWTTGKQSGASAAIRYCLAPEKFTSSTAEMNLVLLSRHVEEQLRSTTPAVPLYATDAMSLSESTASIGIHSPSNTNTGYGSVFAVPAARPTDSAFLETEDARDGF